MWNQSQASTQQAYMKLLEENKNLRLQFKTDLAEAQGSRDTVIQNLNNQLSENIDKHKKAVDTSNERVAALEAEVRLR